MIPPIVVKSVAIAAPILVALLKPKDAILKQLWHRQPLRVWHYETALIMVVLAVIIVVVENFYPAPSASVEAAEWVGWAGLMFAHGRNSVTMRMAEKQRELALAADPAAVQALVPCAQEAVFYLYTGELCWGYYFLDHHAWAGLCGVGVFTGYAWWRQWYTKRRS